MNENNFNPVVPLKRQIDFVFVSKRIRILVIAIIIGMIIIFVAGTFTPTVDIYPQFGMYGLLSVAVSAFLCIISIPVKRILLKKIKPENFIQGYFNASIISLALCDVGGLFGIATNLFLSYNFIYAITCLVIALLYIGLIFPNKKDLDYIKSQ